MILAILNGWSVMFSLAFLSFAEQPRGQFLTLIRVADAEAVMRLLHRHTYVAGRLSWNALFNLHAFSWMPTFLLIVYESTRHRATNDYHFCFIDHSPTALVLTSESDSQKIETLDGGYLLSSLASEARPTKTRTANARKTAASTR